MSQPSIKLSLAQPSEPILAASSNGTHHVCSAWVPDLPQLPPAVLFLNLGKHFRRAFIAATARANSFYLFFSLSCAAFYTVLLLLVLLLCLRSLLRTRRRLLQLGLMLLFAVNRLAWAALLVGVMEYAGLDAEHPFDHGTQLAAFLTNRLGSCLFFALTFFLLTRVADALTIGWKSSRRLWRFCACVAILLTLLAITLAISANWLKPHRFLHLAQYLSSTASIIAALYIIAIGYRYTSIGVPEVLLTFHRVRRVLHFVFGLMLLCFTFRGIPIPLILSILSALGLCKHGNGESIAWVILLHSHWLAELVPMIAMLLLAHLLDSLKIGSAADDATSTPHHLPTSLRTAFLEDSSRQSLRVSVDMSATAAAASHRPSLTALFTEASAANRRPSGSSHRLPTPHISPSPSCLIDTSSSSTAAAAASASGGDTSTSSRLMSRSSTLPSMVVICGY